MSDFHFFLYINLEPLYVYFDEIKIYIYMAGTRKEIRIVLSYKYLEIIMFVIRWYFWALKCKD